MSLISKFERHGDLFRRMAGTVEADLSGAAIEGRLTEQALRNSVFSCTGCAEADACGKWLDDNADGADAPPGYCRNSALFERLSAG